MTRVISVISGKGGTGKTTITANLGAALSKIGKSVLVIDGNISGANLGMHLGIPDESQVTLNDVLKNGAFMTQAVIKHPSGFSIIPAKIGEIDTELGGLKNYFGDFIGHYDFILVDAAAGVNREVEAAVNASDEVLIVTNPELPAIRNAGMAEKMANALGKKTLGIVVNRISGDKIEIPSSEIEKLVQAPVISKIFENRRVRQSIAARKPVVSSAPHTRTSRELMDLAYKVSGEKIPKESLMDRLHYLWNLELNISIG